MLDAWVGRLQGRLIAAIYLRLRLTRTETDGRGIYMDGMFCFYTRYDKGLELVWFKQAS